MSDICHLSIYVITEIRVILLETIEANTGKTPLRSNNNGRKKPLNTTQLHSSVSVSLAPVPLAMHSNPWCCTTLCVNSFACVFRNGHNFLLFGDSNSFKLNISTAEGAKNTAMNTSLAPGEKQGRCNEDVRECINISVI